MKKQIYFVFLSIIISSIMAEEPFVYEKEISALNHIINNATDQNITLSKQNILAYKNNHNIQNLLLSNEQYPTGEAYFLLGDYFFEKELYSEALASYKISIELNYEKDYYSYYNIACVHSISESYDDSYDNLMNALSSGYRHFNWIYKDSDMGNLMNSIEYGDWISLSIEKHKEKYYISPIEIAHKLYDEELNYQEYTSLNNEWKIKEENIFEDYIFSILTNRSSLDPVPLAIFCFKSSHFSFMITTEKIDDSSEQIVNISKNITYYLTFNGDKDEIGHEIIEKAKIIFTHRV